MWASSRKSGVGCLAKSQLLRLSLIITVLMLTFSCQGFCVSLSPNDLVKENISLQAQVIEISADRDAKDQNVKQANDQLHYTQFWGMVERIIYLVVVFAK